MLASLDLQLVSSTGFASPIRGTTFLSLILMLTLPQVFC